MSRQKRKLDEKEPIEVDTQVGSVNNNTLISEKNNTNTGKNQQKVKKGRHWWYVFYPTEKYVKAHYPNCAYDGSDGWGTLADDWIEQLKLTGLSFCVSPLHCNDINDTGTLKKPHWHVIISWGNTTTYETAKALGDRFNAPVPLQLSSVEGAYRYHKHLDNPEKYQYEENSSVYNGFEVPLRNNDIQRIKREIMDFVFTNDIREYAELLVTVGALGAEYFEVASNNTYYCNQLCCSYRHNPYRALLRYYNTLDAGELKDTIEKRLDFLKDVKENR